MNWLLIALGAIPSALLTAGLAWGVHSLDVADINAAHQKDLDDQKTTIVGQCNSAMKKERKASNDYQTALTAMRKRLAARSMYASKCVNPIKAAKSPNGAAPVSGLPAGDGLGVGWIRDYSGRAQTDALKLKGLQDYLTGMEGCVPKSE